MLLGTIPSAIRRVVASHITLYTHVLRGPSVLVSYE